MKLKIIALMMAVLIVTLPISFANSLEIVQYSGSEGIDGFHASTDVLTFVVKAEVDQDPLLERDQLRIRSDDDNFYYNFQECNATHCTYNKNIWYSDGFKEYNIQLFDDTQKALSEATPVAEQTVTMAIDSFPPTVDSVVVSPKTSTTGDMLITVKARDTAIEGEDFCSGLSQFDFFAGEEFLGSHTVEDNACSFSDQIPLKVSIADGRHELCVLATDITGQQTTNPVCDSFILDTSGPKVKSVDFLIDGHKTDFISTDTIADIMMVIDDPNLVVDSITADFSQLSATEKVKPIQINESYFMFKNIDMSAYKTCSIGIYAKDSLGNVLDDTISCSKGIDNLAPEFVSVTTQYTAEQDYFIARKNNLTFTFHEPGSGLIAENVYINMDNFGMGVRNPDACVQMGTQYECYLYFETSIEQAPTPMTITTQTQDLLGNYMSEPAIINIETDTVAPNIVDYAVTVVSDTEYERPGYVMMDDMIEIRFNATNIDTDTVRGDFSIIGGSIEQYPMDCGIVGNRTYTTCVFTQPVQKMGEGDIIINMSNYNKESTYLPVPINVWADVNATNPGFWTIRRRPRCEPSPVDRSITSFINYRLTCKVDLVPLKPNSKVISMVMDKNGCEGDLTDIAAMQMMNPGQHPFFGIMLQAMDYKVNQSEITCPLYVMSEIDGAVTRHPEIINVSLRWKYHDSPYGEPSLQINRKIKDELGAVNSMSSFVEQGGVVVGYLEKFCQMKSMITGILATLDAIIITIGLIGDALTPVAGAGEGPNAAKEALCKGVKMGFEKKWLDDKTWGDTIFKVLDQFCAMLRCSATYDSGYSSQLEGSQQSTYDIGAGGSSLIGGGAWCGNIKQTLNTALFGGKKEKQKDWSINPGTTIPNIEDSIILSSVCWCLPGILKNINELMQIKCRYAVCMGENLVNDGMPPYVCENEKDYNTCKYVYGSIFNILPLDALFDLTKIFKDMYANPFSGISAVVGLACELSCIANAPIGVYVGCMTVRTISKIGDSLNSIETMKTENFFKVSDGYCRQAKKMLKDMEKKEEQKAEQSETRGEESD